METRQPITSAPAVPITAPGESISTRPRRNLAPRTSCIPTRRSSVPAQSAFPRTISTPSTPVPVKLETPSIPAAPSIPRPAKPPVPRAGPSIPQVTRLPAPRVPPRSARQSLGPPPSSPGNLRGGHLPAVNIAGARRSMRVRTPVQINANWQKAVDDAAQHQAELKAKRSDPAPAPAETASPMVPNDLTPILEDLLENDEEDVDIPAIHVQHQHPKILLRRSAAPTQQNGEQP
ncbi:hypothetical protein FIBSPDRAFT_881391 [Athelia psychrophila]|uniref:Uncharacterized protein n=1 Tax=Athelia psychrophila TaxID=1759441 RepID=A0A166WM05_9AGAM|nr:hypothetical protein FIBSPDRAFT_881391 [Fibularhizoctonia sp. CBS 109695]